MKRKNLILGTDLLAVIHSDSITKPDIIWLLDNADKYYNGEVVGSPPVNLEMVWTIIRAELDRILVGVQAHRNAGSKGGKNRAKRLEEGEK